MNKIYFSLLPLSAFLISACATTQNVASGHQNVRNRTPAAITNGPVDLARTKTDVEKIKSIIGESVEIAGAFASTYDNGSTGINLLLGDDYLRAVSPNYVFADLRNPDHPSHKDLAVVVEKIPALNPLDKSVSFGQRELRIYTQNKDGSYTLNTSSENAVLTADEGGQMGDPLEGLKVNSRGSLQISLFGGSSDKWSFTDTYSYRKDPLAPAQGYQFYLSGSASSDLDTHNMSGQSTDIDFLTGNKILTITPPTDANGNSPAVKVVHRTVKRLPLVKLSDMKAKW